MTDLLSPADASVVTAARLLTTGRANHRLAASWAVDPRLGGWTPATALAVARNGDDPRSPTVLAGLVHRLQAGDQDAAVLALAALRPGIWAVARRCCRACPVAAVDDLYTQAAITLARVDPDIDQLYDRILGRIRAATLRARARTRPDQREVLTAEPPEQLAVVDNPVVDQVVARLALHRVVELADVGHTRDTWRALVAIRVEGAPSDQDGDPAEASRRRANVSRLGRALQRLVA